MLVLAARCQEEAGDDAGTVMTVKNYEGHVFIDFFNDEQNMQIGFYPCGVNQLFGIAEVSYFLNQADHHQGKACLRFPSCTDWIGPYFACSSVNRDSGLPQKFTGGWHGSNGDGTGSPTASTKNVFIRTDEKLQNGNFEMECREIDIEVTNFIQGYDHAVTGRDLLKETVHYRITPDRKTGLHVTIEALDDVVIQRYYGLQSQNFSIFDSVKYAADEQIIHVAAVDQDSRCSLNEGINTIILADKEGKHKLRLVLNTREGLGTCEYTGESLPRTFSAGYRKSYFNLVNGKELVLKKGEKVFWKGSYFWD
jgi:hypothetical protein